MNQFNGLIMTSILFYQNVKAFYKLLQFCYQFEIIPYGVVQGSVTDPNCFISCVFQVDRIYSNILLQFKPDDIALHCDLK